MIEYIVTDPRLREQLMIHFIQRIENEPGLMEAAIVDGASPDLIDYLRGNVRLGILGQVAAHNRPDFVCRVDTHALMAAFRQVHAYLAEERTKEALVVAGATTEQLVRWFKMKKEDAIALRNHFFLSRAGGRPKLPDVQVRDEIHHAWAQLADTLPERDAYLALHRQFAEFTVGALWQVVHEHDSDGAAVQPPGKRAGIAVGARA